MNKDILKWSELSGSPETVRYKPLKQVLDELKINHEYTFIQASEEDFQDKFNDLLKSQDHIFISPPFGEMVLSQFPRRPFYIQSLRSSDWIQKGEDQVWWPENLLFESINLEYRRHARDLDISSAVMIVGAGSAARACVAALIKVGFERFNIADMNEIRAEQLTEELKKIYLNIEFKFVPRKAIMLLPGNNSVLINASKNDPSNELLVDLYYFNFLKFPGIILDLNLVPIESDLIKEAQAVNAKVIYGYEIAAKRDLLWLKKVFQKDYDIEKYQKLFRSFLEDSSSSTALSTS